MPPECYCSIADCKKNATATSFHQTQTQAANEYKSKNSPHPRSRRNSPTENQEADSDAREKETRSSDCLGRRSHDKTEAPEAATRSRRVRNWIVGGEEPEHRGQQRRGSRASIRTRRRDEWRRKAPSSSWLAPDPNFFLKPRIMRTARDRVF